MNAPTFGRSLRDYLENACGKGRTFTQGRRDNQIMPAGTSLCDVLVHMHKAWEHIRQCERLTERVLHGTLTQSTPCRPARKAYLVLDIPTSSGNGGNAQDIAGQEM